MQANPRPRAGSSKANSVSREVQGISWRDNVPVSRSTLPPRFITYLATLAASLTLYSRVVSRPAPRSMVESKAMTKAFS